MATPPPHRQGRRDSVRPALSLGAAATCGLLAVAYPHFLPSPRGFYLGGLLLVVLTILAQVRLIRQRARLVAEQAHLRELIEHATDPIYTHDLAGRFLSVNRAGERLTGYARGELLTMTIAQVVAPPDLDTARTMIRRKLAGAGPTAYDVSIQTKAGDTRPVEVHTRLLYEAGRPVAVQGIARDITARKCREAQLTQQAFHDALTGLPNRALFLDRLTQALDQTSRSPTLVGVLFVDLDNFKPINDRWGHAAGDELLRAVARRLSATMRPGDTLARLGGDEFTVLVQGVAATRDVEVVADRLLTALGAPVVLGDQTVSITASIGLMVGRAPATAETCLRQADTALYQAKGAGKARVVRLDAAAAVRPPGDALGVPA